MGNHSQPKPEGFRMRGQWHFGPTRVQRRRRYSRQAPPLPRRVRDGITRCSISEPPSSELKTCQLQRGIPFCPHRLVTTNCNMDSRIEAWGNEYACLGYGAHLHDDLVAFCEQRGIKRIAL